MTSIRVETVAEVLEQTGREIILPAYKASVQTISKSDGSVVTEIDLACQHFIEQELAGIDASVALLGEEMEESEQLACLNRQGSFWCLDPLDGTTNFATSFPGFSLSLALIENGTVTLAAIHDPVRNETFTATSGRGACLNGEPIQASQETELSNSVGFIDFKRLDRETAIRFATEKIYRSQRNVGSCALEWAWLAAGRGQFIIHGGEKVWDFAAGSLIASESGCLAGDFSGRALFPAESLSSPILAACNSSVHEELKLQLGR